VCVCVCVYVRYRTYLNVVGMGSTLLGVLRRTLRWSSKSQKFKKLILKIWFFKRETQKKRENGRGWETVTGAGTGNSKGGGNGKRLRPEQRRVPPTSFEYRETNLPKCFQDSTIRRQQAFRNVCLGCRIHAYETTFQPGIQILLA
jgi:hypothetical protein